MTEASATRAMRPAAALSGLLLLTLVFTGGVSAQAPAPMPGTPGVANAPFSATASAPGALSPSALPLKLGLAQALGAALARNVTALLQRQEVLASEARVLIARGPFDPVIGANAAMNNDPRSLRRDEELAFEAAGVPGIRRQLQTTRSWQVGVEQVLISGIALSSSVGITGTDDSLARLTGQQRQNVGQVALTVRVPLLRNSGRATVGAALDAAQAELEAARLELRQDTAGALAGTAVAYWDFLARSRRLDIARASEARVADLVTELRRLIAADQVPAAEIELALATLAERRTLRLAAEQGVTESWRTLARTIGLSGAESLRAPLPADDFPGHDGSVLDYAGQLDALLAAALDARPDLAALRKREDAARLRVAAAGRNLQPQLDVNVSLFSSGLREGGLPLDVPAALLERRSGPSGGVSLLLSWPYENTAARGALFGQAAIRDSQSIRLRELGASIATNVAVQVEALRRSAAQLREVDEAVRRFTVTLRNEETKRQLGTSTLIDVINVQDRLFNALSLQVLQRQAFATAIALLRLEIGQLVQAGDDVFEVRPNDLLSADFGAVVRTPAASQTHPPAQPKENR
jgi:outer membrane protein